MAPYSNQELRYARPVAEALLESGPFRQWLLAGTKHQNSALEARPVGEIVQGSIRSPNMKNPYWFNYFCHTKCSCKIGTGIETDILLIFDCANGRRLALHIEIKRPGKTLDIGQAESYPRRAACWANPITRYAKVPKHQDFLTMLICGREIESDERRLLFDKVVFHDQVAQRIQIYPESQRA
jgi:hypothetical protein